jgi:hypothetical protein
MKRKDFITSSTLAAASLTTLLAASCTTGSSDKKEKLASAESKDDPIAIGFELNEITISELQDKMARCIQFRKDNATVFKTDIRH